MKLTQLAEKILAGLAREEDLKSAPIDEIRAIKADDSEPHYRFVPQALLKDGDADGVQRTFKHVASDETQDAMGDVIRVRGWDLSRFTLNPQLLWAHDSKSLPIGLVGKAWKGKANGSPALLTLSTLHTADLNPFAEAVRKLVEAGALPGVSVGFVPQEARFPGSEEERKDWGLGEFGVLFERSELLELSVVPVPANKSALRLSCMKAAESVWSELREQQHGADSLIAELKGAFNLTDEDWVERRKSRLVVPALAEERSATDNREVTVKEPAPDVDLAILEAVAATSRATKALIERLEVIESTIEDIEEHLSDRADATVGADESRSATDTSASPADDPDFLTQVCRGALAAPLDRETK